MSEEVVKPKLDVTWNMSEKVIKPERDVTWDMSQKAIKQELGLSESDHGDECDPDDPELRAIRMRVREMEEETERLKDLTTDDISTGSPTSEQKNQSLQCTRRRARGGGLRQIPREHCFGYNRQNPFSPSFTERHLPFFGQPAGVPHLMTAEEKREIDKRSIYVGNVDYGGTAQDLESHFSSCGSINRITILCDKYTGHPKGYAYIEFAEQCSVEAAIDLDESVFRGRTIKVSPKRTNVPGISTTDRGNFPGRSRGNFPRAQRPRGRPYRGRRRPGRWNSSY
ncbi:embryonic polyadenylate-binding protein 2 [Pyxicephalus adspersus]|uniref:RRM domain-containing protein n=1 Tax=Pyxicephalus adspersus TaxID=30357 RepID=A0AAV2ZZW8_PYXAD|nr:TPA: hypothetical protein GDO54_002454 [Pyxicephalus adspersus]